MNTSFFERIGNKLKLTYEGIVMLEYSYKILNLCDETRTHIESIGSDSIKGELRAAMNSLFG
jgi:DNA-binding transcriptional LysR family regulator